MDMQVPFPQRSLAVLREPCDRAGSLLSHLLGDSTYLSPKGTAPRYTKHNTTTIRCGSATRPRCSSLPNSWPPPASPAPLAFGR